MILQGLVDIPLLLAHFRVNVLLSIGFPEIDAMLKTSSKLVSFAIAALIALPAAAGDFGGRSFQRHHGFGHSNPSVFGHSSGWGMRPARFGHSSGWGMRPARFTGGYFAGSYGGFGRGHERNRLLKRFYSPSTNYARSNVVIVVQPPQGEGSGGTYSGSSYAYEADGGTYVGGGGYSPYRPEPTLKLAPMAKVIDVAVKKNSCSYEAGVCVIRP
jgi:hypothetical protein